MSTNWEKYQIEVAEIFQSIGLEAEIEKRIEGARGTHKIDVWVTFNKYGIKIKWVIECKYWKSAIPKEKVLALHQIIQDVGADRGFLLSEMGFQAGAIKVAKNTNISLTSLEELRSNSKEEKINIELFKANKWITLLDSKLTPLIYDKNGDPFPIRTIDKEEIIDIMGDMFTLKLVSPKALAGDYPVWFSIKGKTIYSQNANEFCQNVFPTLELLEEKINLLNNEVAEYKKKCIDIFEQFIKSIEDLITIAEEALFQSSDNSNDFEQRRLKALEAMKRVGKLSSDAKLFATGDLLVNLQKLMRVLIDTVYLHLTKPTISITEWNDTKKNVNENIERLRKVVLA